MENCNAVVFARSTLVRRITKKLHPRFKRLLLFSSTSDIVRVISKHQHDDEAKTIHLLLVDLDSQGLQLCETIQTRPRKSHINGNRFVAIVALASSVDKDSRALAERALQIGIISVVWLPSSLGVIQDAVLKCIRMRTMTEDVHRLVSTNKSTRHPQVQLEGVNKPADVSSEEESDGYDEDDDQLTAVDDSEYESDEGDFLLSESGQSDAQSRTARASSNQRLSTPRLSEGAMNRIKRGLEPPLSARETATDIIDARHRPYLTSTTRRRKNSRALIKQSIERKTMSLESFIRKEAPALGAPSSVVGLPKDLAESVWSNEEARIDTQPLVASKRPGLSTGEVSQVLSHESIASRQRPGTSEKHSTQRDRQRQRRRLHQLLESTGGYQALDIAPVPRNGEGPHQQQRQQQKLLHAMVKSLPTDLLQHEAIAIDPRTRRTVLSEQLFLQRGWDAFTREDWSTAESYWKRGLHRSIDDNEPSYLCSANLAVVAFRLKKYEEALNGFTSTLAILRTREASWLLQDEGIMLFNRGVTWLRVGHDQKGVTDLRLAQMVDSQNLAVQAALALALRRTGAYTEAEAAYTQLAQVRQSGNSRTDSRASSPPWLHGASLLLQIPDDSDSDTDTSASTPARSRRTESNFDSEVEVEANVAHAPGSPKRNSSHKIGSDISDTPSTRARSRTQSSIKKSHQRMLLHKQARSTQQKAVETVAIDSGLRESLRSRIESQDCTGVHEPYVDLGVYRTTHGLGADLFDTLFVRPTPLQEALCTPPGVRQCHQLDEICAFLRALPLVESLDEYELQRLASEVEYRALRTKCTIISQGQVLEFCGVVLSGEVVIRLQSTDGRSAVVAKLGERCSFGEFDLLYAGAPDTWPSSHEIRTNHSTDAATDQSQAKKTTRSNVVQSAFFGACVLQPTELLLIPAATFNSLLRGVVLRQFWSRVQLLKGSGIFKEWPFDDIARLARLAFLRGYDDERVILRQGDKPSWLFIVSKGVCRVERAPHNTVRLGRDLQDTIRQLEHIQTQYSFHHRLRHIVPPTPIGGNQGIHPFGKTTLTQIRQKELAAEIDNKRAALVELKQTQSDQVCEMGTINRPRIFGEACILEPVDGVAPGTIAADGYCEVLALHHLQLELFEINQTFIESLQAHSFQYSDDTELAKLVRRDIEWKQYKQALTLSFTQRKR